MHKMRYRSMTGSVVTQREPSTVDARALYLWQRYITFSTILFI